MTVMNLMHVEKMIECKELNIINEEIEKIPNYENIFSGTVSDQTKIAKIFQKHLKIIEEIKQKKK